VVQDAVRLRASRVVDGASDSHTANEAPARRVDSLAVAALTPAPQVPSAPTPSSSVEHLKTKRDAAKRASSGLRLNVSEPCVGSLGESE
jgi:hypothetical protein